jgi:Tfp pilus assembly protein PilF
MIIKLFKLVFIITLISNPLMAKNQYFKEGLGLFENKKFKKAKFKFEQDVVYNPKNELSYLYLSKIFKNLNKKDLQEHNLNTVILLNPRNEEAIFNLAKLKLENSDYEKSKELNNKLKVVCNKFCDKSAKLKIEIENLSKK